MVAYRRVYDSRHLLADCQEPGSAPEPMLCNLVWATFTFFLFGVKYGPSRCLRWLFSGRGRCAEGTNVVTF